MRGASLLLVAVLAAGPAGAGERLPALFEVAGVVPGDVLNVRAAPDAASPPIATLPRDATGIEVTAWSPDDRWGRVNVGDAAGWVARRYLAPLPGPEWPDDAARLSCSGTEPFWDLHLAGPMASFRLPLGDDAGRRLAVQGRAQVAGVSDASLGLRLDEGFATIRPAECTDGMSDRQMGLAIDLFLTEDGDMVGFTGCCSVVP